MAQVDGSLTRVHAGTGLDPLSTNLVKLPGGTTDRTSEHGKGTTVTVNLPPQAAVAQRRMA